VPLFSVALLKFEKLIEAFAASRLAQQGWQYVVVGGREPGADTAINLARQTPGVVLPGYTTDEQLRWLYRNASGFVLMSLLEGFGMPVIEAIEHDLPCLVSRSSILTEVGGDAMLAVPDIQATAIRLKDAAIVGQASASDVIGRGAQAGRAAQRFSVQDITEATALALMEDMLTGKR